MLINNLMTNSGADIFYNKEFRIVIEDHMTFIRTNQDMSILSIESAIAYKYEGDLFGLLAHYNIPFDKHWIIMRVNKMTTPTEASDTLSSLLIPGTNLIERIRSVYMTRDRVIH